MRKRRNDGSNGSSADDGKKESGRDFGSYRD